MPEINQQELNTAAVSSRFNLGLYFAITSLIVLCLLGIFLWRYHVRVTTEVITEMTHLQNEHITQSVEAAIRQSMSQVLGNNGESKNIDIGYVDQLVREKTLGFPIEKVKIYDSAGLTIYSTDPREIGKAALDNPGVRSALNGDIFTSFVSEGDEKPAEYPSEKDSLLQTYMPLLDASRQRRIGVFEIYTDTVPTLEKISFVDNKVLVVTILSFLVLYGLLCLIVMQAHKIIRARESAIDHVINRLNVANQSLKNELTEQERKLDYAIDNLRQLSMVMENNNSCVLITDAEGYIEYANAACERISGYSEDELKGTLQDGFLEERRNAKKFRGMRKRLLEGQDWCYEYKKRNKSGDLYFVSARITPIPDEQDQITHFMCMEDDVTEQKKTEERLIMAARVFENAVECIVVTDSETRIVSVNPAFTKVTGYDYHEVLGEKISILNSGRHDKEFYGSMWRSLLSEGSWQGEIVNRRRNGEVYSEILHISSITDTDGKVLYYVGIFSDTTKSKKTEELVDYLTNYDLLTGLANRVLLKSHAKDALRKAEENGNCFAVMFVDLDRFKNINDTLGYAVGDTILKVVADRLKMSVGIEDTVARLGGDEFAIVLNGVEGVEDVEAAAEKTLEELSSPVGTESGDVMISASIGISMWPNDKSGVEAMFQNANSAMYDAIMQGGGRFKFYKTYMNEQAEKWLAIESGLRRGLEQREFTVHFQAQLDVLSGRVMGVESLVRWSHPENGLIMPDEFMGCAEHTGLIVPIGEYVLRESCEVMAMWNENGRAGVRLAVNVSARQLEDLKFINNIEKILQETGFPAEQLELELTEKVLLGDSPDVMRHITALRDTNIQLSIDDFGSGYSSMGYLRSLPIDRVKIDKSFIRSIPENIKDCEIVKTIIDLAHKLNFQVVAEGVETHEQLTFLRECGCDEVQGYLLHTPCGFSNLDKVIREVEGRMTIDDIEQKIN